MRDDEETFWYIMDSLKGAFVVISSLICFDIIVTYGGPCLRRWYL